LPVVVAEAVVAVPLRELGLNLLVEIVAVAAAAAVRGLMVAQVVQVAPERLQVVVLAIPAHHQQVVRADPAVHLCQLTFQVRVVLGAVVARRVQQGQLAHLPQTPLDRLHLLRGVGQGIIL
jgi:hypothetical protein